jgi:hypothetical protein
MSKFDAHAHLSRSGDYTRCGICSKYRSDLVFCNECEEQDKICSCYRIVLPPLSDFKNKKILRYDPKSHKKILINK